MTLLNTRPLVQFARKHRDAAAALEHWVDSVRDAQWRSIVDIRKIYPNADGVRVKVKGHGIVVATVFNIKGNEYRLITVVDFVGANVIVKEVLTHAEYDRDSWKDRL
jgi:mRNA interferase HigB